MAFNLPAQTGLAPLKPTSPTFWTRPVDWPTITDTAGEAQFLVADTGAASYAISTTFNRDASQDLLIDWGDGTTSTISTTTATTTQHTYAIGGGTPCSRGYTTYKIRIYGSAAGVTITDSRFVTLTSAVNGSIPYQLYSFGVLEAYYGDGIDIASMAYYFGGSLTLNANSLGNFPMLEYCKLPASMPNTTLFNNAFDYCSSLARVVMPTSAPSLTNFTQAFRGCSNLETLTFPSDATGITTLTSTFNICARLTTVVFPSSMNSCADMNATFLACPVLNTVSLPSMNSCTNYVNAFSSCYALTNFKMTSWTSSATAIAVSGMFSTCVSLETFTIPNPTAGSSFVIQTMFTNCQSLRQIVFPENFTINGSMSAAFTACYNLISVVFPSVCTITTMASCFSNCYNLQSVTLPTSNSGGVIMTSCFNNCYSLQSITISSGFVIGTAASMFLNCYGLKTATFTGAQNSITAFSAAFQNCYNLESVVLPSSMTSCVTIQTTFQNCYKLTSVSFPTTMNAVTTMQQCFDGCYNLESVTLPTSMTALAIAGLITVFNNCISLQTATLPATVSSAMQQTTTMFNGCFNLKTVTLPTTQTTSWSICTNMFQNCTNLTTVNNSVYLGNNATGATQTVDGSALQPFAGQLTAWDFSCKFSKLNLAGTSGNRNNLTSLRLRNTGAASGSGTAQWGGTSPQLSIAYTNMDTAAINQLFTDLAAAGYYSGKTIDITGATGAATCTRSIVTSQGWTVTG
jgi:hypothetical protein